MRSLAASPGELIRDRPSLTHRALEIFRRDVIEIGARDPAARGSTVHRFNRIHRRLARENARENARMLLLSGALKL